MPDGRSGIRRPSQPSFSAGEASPSVYGRVDQERYGISARTMRNFLPRMYGGADNRPGTRFIVECGDETRPVRLIEFQFSDQQTYVIEAGHQYMRFIRAGGVQLEDGGSPVEIATPYTDDQVYELSFAQSADVLTIVHPDHPPQELKRLSETNWTLTPYDFKEGPFLDINTDESLFIHSSAQTGTVTLTATAAVFKPEHVGALIYLEELNKSRVRPWEANKFFSWEGNNAFGVLRRNDGKVYECQDRSRLRLFQGSIPPTHEKGVDNCGDGSSIFGQGTGNKVGVEWLYLHSGYGVARITAYTSPTSVTATVLLRIPNTIVGGVIAAQGPWGFTGDGTQVDLTITGATSSDPGQYEVFVDDVLQAPGEQYTISLPTLTFVTAPPNSSVVTARQLSQANRTSVFAFGAWSDEQGWPSVVSYFGDRQAFARTRGEPQAIWATRIGRYNEFKRSTPLQADDRLSMRIPSRKVNAVVDMVPLSSLVVLTTGGEWRLRGGEDGVLAPDAFNLDPQTYYGAAPVRAVEIGNTAIYVQRQGGSVRDISFSFEDDGFTGGDLSYWSDHLFEEYRVTQLAYHQEPYSVVWAVREDGRLLSMVYVRNQEVMGWSWHDTGTDAGDAFEQAVVIEGDGEDEVYFVVRRNVNGQVRRYIEKLQPRITLGDWRRYWFADSALVYDGRNTTSTTLLVSAWSSWGVTGVGVVLASTGIFDPNDVGSQLELIDDASGARVRLEITAYNSATLVQARALSDVPAEIQDNATTNWIFKRMTLAGLDHLEDRIVCILSDGNVEPTRSVNGGEVVLDRPGGWVVVGLPYESDLETLEINDPGRETLRGRQMTIPAVDVLVRESRGLFAGPSPDQLYEYKQRTDETYEDPVRPLTDVARIEIATDWSEGGRVFMRQTDPLPLSVLQVIPKVVTGGA